MPTITKFGKAGSTTFVRDLEAYLAPFLAERGVTMKLGNWKYTDDTVRLVSPTFRIEAGSTEKDADRLRTALQMAGIILAGDTRTVFESAQYVLTDYRPKAWKRPWLARSKLDGKTYVLEHEAAVVHFSKK